MCFTVMVLDLGSLGPSEVSRARTPRAFGGSWEVGTRTDRPTGPAVGTVWGFVDGHAKDTQGGGGGPRMTPTSLLAYRNRPHMTYTGVDHTHET